MFVALLSDIHGNLPALEAVLKDAGRAKAKQIWCLGDLIGYLPSPNACIGLIQKAASASVVGNYDQKVIQFDREKRDWKKSKKKSKFDAFEWNHQHLHPQSQRYLRSLPQTLRRKIGRFDILLTHGSPQSIDEPVLPDTPQQRLIELGHTADADIIVMGHTHRFMNRKVGSQWFINPGSIGLPLKKDLRASYALLNISQDKINVTERKIHYDISKVIHRLQKADVSRHLVKMIEREYGLDLKNELTPSLIPGQTSKSSPQDTLKTVRRLAGECHYEKEHSEHVTLLALNLFDELQPLHKLSKEDKFLLHCAALLHDIGWMEGQKGHHKTAMKIILNARTLPFDDDQRRIIALIARYHRKALPKESHSLFSQLTGENKKKTRILGGILRVADGLDRTHTFTVKSLTCKVSKNDVLVKYKATCPSSFEMEAAYKKSDLLMQALGKHIRFKVI